MTEKLTAAARDAALRDVPQWTYDTKTGAISRTFKFADFATAFAFRTEIAQLAEHANHHPDWSNSYNQVVISLTTHDVGGLSSRDIALATAIDALTPASPTVTD